MKGIFSVIFILFAIFFSGFTPFDFTNISPQYDVANGNISSYRVAQAAVRVRGYYRKDGTYVQPHYRSNPDGNPYNNWSFPGNTNPYTGETASGNPDTYLKNYCEKSPNNSYCTGLDYLPASISLTGLSTLSENTLIRREGAAQVYRVNGNKKYWIPTKERFEAFGYRWSDIRVVPYNFTDGVADGILTYRGGALLKSPNLPFVWMITSDSARKWIPDTVTFKECGFNWSNISIVPESEIQSLTWAGDTIIGKVIFPSCE